MEYQTELIKCSDKALKLLEQGKITAPEVHLARMEFKLNWIMKQLIEQGD